MLNITRYYLKKLFREFYCVNGRLLLMVAVFSFYTSYEFRILDGSNCSVTEYALYAMSDYYYFIFFFLVVYSVIIFGEIKDSSLLVLQRTVKYGYYYAGKLAAVSVFTGSVILLHVIIAALIGLAGHGWGNAFVVPEGHLSEIGFIFQDAFRTPAGALAAVCCYRILGLSLYAGILLLLSHYVRDKVIIVLQTIVYLLTIVTLHRNVDLKIPLMFLINYLFLHRALMYRIAVWAVICGVAVLTALLLAAGLWKVHMRKFFQSLRIPVRILGGIFTVKRITALVFIDFLLALGAIVIFRFEAHSGAEYIPAAFMGYGLGYMNLTEFLHLIILNGIPIYILSVYFGDKDSMRNHVMIRYTKSGKWFLCVQYSMLLFIIFQLGLQCIITFILGTADTFLGISGSFGKDMMPGKSSLFFLVAAGFGLRVLELMFLQMLYFLLFSCLKNITASFLLTMSLYLSVVSFRGKWLPFGLSSLYRVIGLEGEGIYWNVLISAVIFISGYLLIYGYFMKCDVVRKITCGRN